MGAATQAAMKERNEAVKEIILTDVCPFTLGTEVVSRRSGGVFEAGHYLPLIERNSVIPVSHTERLYTVSDRQTRIKVDILQGESRLAANNVYLGSIEVMVPPAPAGEECVDLAPPMINSILTGTETSALLSYTSIRPRRNNLSPDSV